MDYEALYRESSIIFPTNANQACMTINTYHDNLEERVEKFIVTAVRRSGVGRFSQSPQTTEMFILSAKGVNLTVMHHVFELTSTTYMCMILCSGSSDSIN